MSPKQKPAWDDAKRMPLWIDAMLDAELEAAVAATFNTEGMEAMAVLSEPLPSLLGQLNAGTASPAQQARAAQLIAETRQPRRRGRKAKRPMERDALLAIVARDARRIMALWRKHYCKSELDRAVDLACQRWLDVHEFHDADAFEAALNELADRVHDNLRRAKARNFGAI